MPAAPAVATNTSAASTIQRFPRDPLGGGAVLEPQGNVNPVAFVDDVADPAVPPAEACRVPDLVAADARRRLDWSALLEPRREPTPDPGHAQTLGDVRRLGADLIDHGRDPRARESLA